MHVASYNYIVASSYVNMQYTIAQMHVPDVPTSYAYVYVNVLCTMALCTLSRWIRCLYGTDI